VFVTTGHEQLCPGKYLCHLLKLSQKPYALLEAFLLHPLTDRLLFASEAYLLVPLGGYTSEYPVAVILLSHAVSLPKRAVVV
jgi:hypothetical protein